MVKLDCNRDEYNDITDIADFTYIIKLFKKKKDTKNVPILLDCIHSENEVVKSNGYYYLGRILVDHNSDCYDLTLGFQYIHIAAHDYNHKSALCLCAMWSVKMSERIKLYEKAADLGSNYATTWLGRYHYKNHNKNKGLKLLTIAANKNYDDAINELAYLYYKKKQYTKSFELYLKSHNLGNIIGTKHVGLAYVKGKGIKKDKTKGEELLTQYWFKTKDYSVIHSISKVI